MKHLKNLNWSSFITTIATVFLAYYAFSAHQDAKNNTLIQFRSYVSLDSVHIQRVNQENWQITYGIKNSGATPAYNVKVTLTDSIGGTITNKRSLGANSAILPPGATTYQTDNKVADSYLKLITSNSTTEPQENFLSFRIEYEDYAHNLHFRDDDLEVLRLTDGGAQMGTIHQEGD